MNQNKILRKIALSAVITFIISIGIVLTQFPYRSWQNKNRIENLNERSAELTQQYQNYLASVAQEIKTIPVDQRIVSEIQSKLLEETSGTRHYLWMMNANEEFVFGVPPVAFSRLNSAYEKYRNVIQNDDHYQNQNDFLMKLVNKCNEIDFSEFALNAPPGDRDYQWRFYNESVRPYYYSSSPYFILSSAVVNDAGAILGNLYLKIDDSANKQIYYSRSYAEQHDFYSNFPLFAILAGLSGLFLWFLLPTWVYIDAQQRDVKNPILWAFLTLISFIFGLTVYLITRPSTMKTVHCPQCEKELNGTKIFCPYCGFDVSSTFCSQCQYPVKSDWSFCPSCRTEIGKQTPDSVEQLSESE